MSIEISRSSAPSRLLSLLKDDDADAFASLGRPATLAKGATLYEEGTPCKYAYTLNSGVLMLERLSMDGRRQVLAFVYPGDFIGIEVSGRHLVSAVALKEATLTRFAINDVEALARERASIDQALKQVTNRILAYALDQICVLGRMDARQRLMFLFVHLMHRQGLKEPVDIDIPMTRQDMADFLGLTMETISRTVSRLKNERLITQSSAHCVTINDLPDAEVLLDLSVTDRSDDPLYLDE
ncbi:MAG: helix-turn-helix domain-containing protein [Pseudomonadota bacterium]